MMYQIKNKLPQFSLFFVLKFGIIAGIFIFLFNTAWAAPTQQQPPPMWQEPRGINVADMVGLVPESHLRDAIIAYKFEHGLAQYESGSRNGNTVTVNVKYAMTRTDEILCLTKAPFADEFLTAMAESTVRIFENGNDVTHEVRNSLSYVPAGFRLPNTNSNNNFRYNKVSMQTSFDSSGSLKLPANMGCVIPLNRNLNGNVTARFTINSGPPNIAIETVHATVFNAQSAIFVGYNGNENILSLNTQMVNKYQNQMEAFGRHDGWAWWRQSDDVRQKIVNNADYVFIKPPPAPVDMYGSTNKLGGGTMRLLRSDGSQFKLSVDHVNSMMIPLHLSWADSDFHSNDAYLPTFRAFEFRGAFMEFDEVKPPEYFLPPGIPYQACMSNGGCPDSLLQQIWEHEYPMEIYFYKVTRIRGGLHQVPLRAVSKAWSPGALVAPLATVTNPLIGGDFAIYLPTLHRQPTPDMPDPSIPCPCGWFDDFGRMVDFIE